jgi:UDP-sugar pyrophosphorylase
LYLFAFIPVHHLLPREGLIDTWSKDDVFLQDTNALVINSILPTLGVSVAMFHMNSICIPRLAWRSCCHYRVRNMDAMTAKYSSVHLLAGGFQQCRFSHHVSLFLLSLSDTDPNKSLVINVEYNQLDPLLGHRVIAR